MSAFFAPPAEATINRNATLLISLGAAFTTLTTVSFILRVWVRSKIVACWGKDDWVMLVTQACYVTTCGLLFQWAENEASLNSTTGLGKFVESYNLLLISNATYLITNLLLKTSLALFFLRFVIERWARLTIWGITTVLLVWTSAVFFVSIFYCGVPTDILKKSMEGGQCISERTTLILGITWGVSNVATDWCFVLIPMIFLLKSRLPRATKVSAGIVMAIAVVGSCTAIPRISSYKDLHGSGNYWTTTTRFLTWSIVEPGVGILAANSATLRPLLDKLMRACVNERGVVEVEQGISHTGVSSNKCDSKSTEPKSHMSSVAMFSTTSSSSIPPAWETELDFVTAKTFDDSVDSMEKGH